MRARRLPWWLGFLGLFLALVTPAEMALSPARSQPGTDPLRIVILKSRDIPPYDSALKGFQARMAAGGIPFRMEILTLEGGGQTREETIERLRREKPDQILTLGTAATRSVLAADPGVPVIFSLVLLSSSQEILDTARSDGIPVTGAAMDVPVRLQFEKARELLPDVHRIGVFYNPAETGAVIEEATRVATRLGLELVPIEVNSESELQERLRNPWPDVDLLWSVADGTVFTPRTGEEILLETLRREVPFIGLSPSFVKAGALMSFSCHYESVGAQAADQALRIAAGESANSIPMSLPGEVSYYLNLHTAKQIGVEVPKQFLDEAEVLF